MLSVLSLATTALHPFILNLDLFFPSTVGEHRKFNCRSVSVLSPYMGVERQFFPQKTVTWYRRGMLSRTDTHRE